jgi:hypothetical protein
VEDRNSVVAGRNPVVGNQVEGMHHPGGNLVQGNRRGDILVQEELDTRQKAARMLAVVHIQQEVGLADRCVTSVALEALP